MDEKDVSDDELEEELENTLKVNEKKRDVFRIIRNEKELIATRIYIKNNPIKWYINSTKINKDK